MDYVLTESLKLNFFTYFVRLIFKFKLKNWKIRFKTVFRQFTGLESKEIHLSFKYGQTMEQKTAFNNQTRGRGENLYTESFRANFCLRLN